MALPHAGPQLPVLFTAVLLFVPCTGGRYRFGLYRFDLYIHPMAATTTAAVRFWLQVLQDWPLVPWSPPFRRHAQP
jgi:hypothetical protein